MKFLVDAQLPRHLSESLKWRGHDVLHTLDLASGNETTDQEINNLSVSEQRVVITKDADFVNSFLLAEVPFKLLLISTGNISNKELMIVFEKNLPAIVVALQTYNYVEISRTSLIEHQ